MKEPSVLEDKPEAGSQLIGCNVEMLKRRQVVKMKYRLGQLSG